MNKHKQEYRVGTGATSMLMIFIVLCLTTLAILSYSSARADYTISERNAMMVRQSYDASNRAQRIIAEIDAQLIDARNAAADDAEYEALVSKVAVGGVAIDSKTPMRLRFSVDAGYDRALDVALEIPALSEAGPRYYLARHVLAYDDEKWLPESEEYQLFQPEGYEMVLGGLNELEEIEDPDDLEELDDLDDSDEQDDVDEASEPEESDELEELD